MPYIVGYRVSEATNLFYSATIAIITTIEEIRSIIVFFFFGV